MCDELETPELDLDDYERRQGAMLLNIKQLEAEVRRLLALNPEGANVPALTETVNLLGGKPSGKKRKIELRRKHGKS